MRTRLTGLALALLLAGTASSAGAEATPPIPITRPTAALEADLRALSRIGSGSHGSVGIAAWRLDGKGPQILVNADDLFPMASTFKVAVAAALLSKVEAGSVRLDQMIDIKLDRMVESEVLQDRFIHPGLSVSVANLLELMLTESDNTATDYITALAGGPAGVTGWIRSQGLEGIRVDSDTSQLIRRHEDAPATGTFKEAMEAALKANRPRAYEDFIAVAEDLIARRITSPARLGIKGGSNGGLLVGNMYTMRPELFGAVVCQVPLLDMRRFHTLLAGASWMGEYGNPDLPEEWAFIKSFSPYHNVDPAQTYPPLLITTSTRDDRVHPAHARKMTARLREMSKDVLYYENIEGGHGGAADNKQRAFMDALGWTFLRQKLRAD